MQPNPPLFRSITKPKQQTKLVYLHCRRIQDSIREKRSWLMKNINILGKRKRTVVFWGAKGKWNSKKVSFDGKLTHTHKHTQRDTHMYRMDWKQLKSKVIAFNSIVCKSNISLWSTVLATFQKIEMPRFNISIRHNASVNGILSASPSIYFHDDVYSESICHRPNIPLLNVDIKN